MMNQDNHDHFPLEELCCQAIKEGQKLDLEGCAYDSRSLKSNHVDPPDYYCFLAGLTSLKRFTRILEIGTFMGGSISSMSKGLSESASQKAVLVTVDIEDRSECSLKAYPYINKIQGDSLNPATVRQVARCFDENIDMLFIDSEHTYWHVKSCIGLYANRLRPKYLILDDIHYNPSMEKLWKELRKHFKDRAFDLTEMVSRTGCGLGVVYWGGDFSPSWLFTGMFLSILDPLRKSLLTIGRKVFKSVKNCLGK
jgi:predicted O-methyltransferase YrrM